MFSVYVNKYTPIPNTDWSNGNQETLLFSIPNQNGNVRPFLSAQANGDMGSAGSFEFKIDADSIWYDIWQHMRTLVRVEYDGTTVFFGRVLTIDRDMFRTKTIHCEGALTFFMDSVFEGTKKGYTITVGQYLQKLIDAHNECMTSAPEKKIFLGEVPGSYSNAITDDQKILNDTQKFAASQGYKSVKEHLDSLIGDYAGSMRIRYENGTAYLDWMKNYFNSAESNQQMSVSSNTIDLSDTVEVSNIFTHVIPVGKNNKYIGGGGGGQGGEDQPSDDGQYTITCSVNPNVSIDGKNNQITCGKLSADAGEKVNFIAIPAPGYSFSSWTVRPAIVTVKQIGAMNGQIVMPAGNIHVIANFVFVNDEGIIINEEEET